MEIKIIRSEILKGLGLMQGIVEKKTTIPILNNILLEAKGRTLSIIATDLEVGLNCAIHADVMREGKIAVHARSVYDIIRELPEEIVHINVTGGNWIEIVCSKSKFRIVGLPPDEFPALPHRGKGEIQKIEGKTLLEMIDKTAFAMSSDETRYNLNGVYFDRGNAEGMKIRMVATDGHRLSVVDRDVQKKWAVESGVIIPRKGVIELKKLVEGEGVEMDLCVNPKHLVAYKDNVTLIIRLIEGQFPPYEQVIPQKAKRVLSSGRASFIQSMKRVSVLSTDRTRGVKLSISPKNLEILASNPDIGEAREELSVEYHGESFDIGFNAKYFIEALSVIEDEKAVLEFGDDTAPCVIRSEIDRGFMHVIMPMRL